MRPNASVRPSGERALSGGPPSQGASALKLMSGPTQVTRERIRQIEAKALRKLRHPSRSRKLNAFLEGRRIWPSAVPLPAREGSAVRSDSRLRSFSRAADSRR